VLNHGRIAETGRHEQLMAHSNGIYQRLYLLQQWGNADEAGSGDNPDYLVAPGAQQPI